MSDQLILKFPSHQAYKKEDFYVSPSNQEAYDIITSWPKWMKRTVNIFGPSGSGKSTLIRCLNRLEAHQEGTIHVSGIELHERMKDIDVVRQDIGMVFQSFNLFPH